MISVIIYVYNDEEYLYHCLNSVLKQSYQNFEIICIDDYSNDESNEILNYFLQKDSRIKLITNDSHKGVGYSMNLAIESAQGEYILFLEGADWYSFDALETLADEAEKNNLDILMFNSIDFYENEHAFNTIQNYENGNILNKFEGEVFNHWDVNKKKLFKIPIKICNCLYSKYFLEENNIYFREDSVHNPDSFLFNAIINAKRISYVNAYLYNNRILSNSIIIRSSEELLATIQSVYLILDVFFKNKEIYEYYKKEVLTYIFSSVLGVNYAQIENQYKEEYIIQSQDVIKNFINEYGLYEDIKENIDKSVLKLFKFNDIVLDETSINELDINKNEVFSLWIPDNEENELPILAYLSLKSMLLCGHEVILYTYQHLNNIPEGVDVKDANEIIDSSKIFRYKDGHKTYSGFANLFRLKRLYEFGGTWIDLDILLIRNINEKFNNDYIIVSEPTKQFYLHPNNAILRFPKNDKFVKEMLDVAMKKGKDVVHGETGPKLVSKMLKTSFKHYSTYLKHFNFNNILKWNDIEDYSKTPEDLLNYMNTDEIVGFHMFNTFFKKIIDSFNPNSFFGILKKIILTSNSTEEYKSYLKKYNIIKTNRDYDLKYLNTIKKGKSYTYALLIDGKILKKSEIYNLFHSIGVDDSYNIQTFVFSRTSLPNDKVKFSEDFYMFSGSLNEIYYDIQDYIQSEYIIPINKALTFNLNFFKEKHIDYDIEQYILNTPDSYLNIFSKESFEKLIVNNSENIFNLPLEKMEAFKVKTFMNDLIYDYTLRSNDAAKLIRLINRLNENPDEFLDIKNELMKLKFKNLIDEVSFYYYTSYENIKNSNNYNEFKLKEDNSNLDFLTSFYLNRISDDYRI